MNRHTITHPDGNKSTRNSKTRVYTHGVVVTANEHKRVVKLRTEAQQRREQAAAYRADAGEMLVEDQAWSRGATWRKYSLENPTGGEPLYLGNDIIEADGTVQEPVFNRETASAEHAALEAERADALDRNADQLAAGPELTYSVWRWSSDAAAAAKYAAQLAGKGFAATVVPVD
jgi:hypothetical protein